MNNWQPPHIEHGIPTQWHWVVYYPDNLMLGENTDIGAFTFIQAEYGVEIGEGAQIGGGCMIYSANTINQQFAPVIIGEGARIGANSVILPGSVIKAGQMIKALSVVYFDGQETRVK